MKSCYIFGKYGVLEESVFGSGIVFDFGCPQ